MQTTRPLVIGIGNRFREDDAVGCLLAERLEAAGFETLEHSGEPASLMEAWQGRANVILLDAVFSGAAPGTLHVFDLMVETLPASFAKPTTHAIGVAEAVEFARVLGKLPARLAFYGIEGQSYGSGTALSSPVVVAAEALFTRLQTDLKG